MHVVSQPIEPTATAGESKKYQLKLLDTPNQKQKTVLKSPSPRQERKDHEKALRNDYSQDSQQDDLDHFSETAALPLRMINDDLTSGGKDHIMLNPNHAPIGMSSLKLTEQERQQFSEQ